MNPRNTAILALVVAALAAFVYFYEIRGAEQRAEAEADAKRLFAEVEADAIEAIELQSLEGRPVRLERDEQGWRLREPIDFPADGPAVDGLASSLAQLSSEAAFDDPAPLEDYGLVEVPEVRFRVGDQQHVLRVGDKTPVGGNTYVMLEGDPRVYTVATYRASALRKKLDDLRDRRVLPIDREAVEEIRVGWPGGGVVLARREQGWRLLEPLEDRADARTVEDLLSDLAFLRASGFVDEPPPDAELGLEEPEFSVELSLAPEGQGEEPRRLSFAVGATRDGEERVVRGALATARYRIPAERLDAFPRRVGAYRFKELADFEVEEAQGLRIVFHDEGESQSTLVSGQREEGGWTTTPEAMAPAKVASLISRVARLRAEDVAEEALTDEELAALGLAPPRVAIQVLGAAPEVPDPPLLADVQLGVARPDDGIAARRADRDTVFWLDYELGEHLPLSLEALRNRFLVEEEEAAELGAGGPTPETEIVDEEFDEGVE